MLKIKDPKILLLLIPFVVIVGFLTRADKVDPLEFEANGIVSVVSWEGKNHGMPLLIIRQNNNAGTNRKIESNDIILTPSQIKVGDKFIKVAGSRTCSINTVDVPCIK